MKAYQEMTQIRRQGRGASSTPQMTPQGGGKSAMIEKER
jgi:hypothetical protein